MKIYLASSFSLIPKVIKIAENLEMIHGNKITVKWWDNDNINIHREKDDTLHPENFYNHPACKEIYERDYTGVKQCDHFILVAGDIPCKFNGANIELGIALALGKDCFSIGKLENCALYYPVIKFDTLEQYNHYILRLFFPEEPDFIDDYNEPDFSECE